MPEKIRRRTSAAITLLGAAGVSLLAGIFADRWQESKMDRLTQIEQTYDSFMSNMKDLETGQRGYLLTRDRLFLEPYNSSIDDVRKVANQLKELDNGAADRIVAAAEHRIGFLERSIADLDRDPNLTYTSAQLQDSLQNGLTLMTVVRRMTNERRDELADEMEWNQQLASLIQIIAALFTTVFTVLGFSLIMRNLSLSRMERVLAEERRDLMVTELNHRVKNVLATVQTVISQTVRNTPPDPKEFARILNDRILSLGRAHDLITQSSWQLVKFNNAIDVAMGPWQDNFVDRFDINSEVDNCFVTARQAQAIILALHELTSNAAKFGALSNEDGKVEITAKMVGSDSVRIDWKEVGGPPIETPPKLSGFGSRLLTRALPRDLGEGSLVDLQFPWEGAQASISFPLTVDNVAATGKPVL